MGDKLGVGEEEFKKEIEGLIITDPDTVKTAFKPLCTQVNEIVTAESFDDVEK